MTGSITVGYEDNDLGLGLTNVYGFDPNDPKGTLNALMQFSGEEASSQGRFATESVDRNFGNIGTRMNAIRQGARLGSGLGFNLNGTDIIRRGEVAETSHSTPLVGGSAGSAGGESGWGWFATGDYGFGDRDATGNEDEYEFDSYGVTVGVDYAFGSGWVVGAAVGFDDYEVEFDDGGGQTAGGDLQADGLTLSAFAMYNADQGYVSGIVSYGESDFEMDRVAVIPAGPGAGTRRFASDTDSDQLAAQLTAGKIFGTGAVTFDVYGSLDLLTIDVDGFTEQDLTMGSGLALVFDNQDIDSFQSVIGGTLRRAINTDSGVVVPYIGLEWRHEFDNEARFVTNRYAFALAGSNPAGFRTRTDDPDEDFGEVTVGISAQFQNGLFIFAQWDAAIALEDTTANLFSIGIRGIF